MAEQRGARAAPANVSAIASIGRQQQQRREAQLHIGGARDHAPDIRDARIGPDRPRQRRMAEPDRARRASPPPPARRRRSMRRAPPRSRRSAPAPARRISIGAARRRRGGAQRIVHPGERIEQLEEEHEGRHQRPLGPAVAAQRHHLRDQVEVVRARPAPPGVAEMRAVVHDIGVGQQQQFGRRRPRPRPAHRPELAAPAGRARRARPAPSAADRPMRAGDGAGAVAAAVVHQDDPERPGVILRQQRAQRCADRPAPRRAPAPRPRPAGRTGGPRGRQLRAGLPELPVQQQQIDPDQQRQDQRASSSSRSMPLARNQATASSTAWRAGRGAIAEFGHRLGRGIEHLLARHLQVVARHHRRDAGAAAPASP